jgi:hypothetical protein
MGLYAASVAAATAVIGYDLLVGQVWARSPKNRVLQGAGLKGSAAALDTEVEIFIDEIRIGDLFNTGTGYPNNDDILPFENNVIPAGAQLRVIVKDAPVTNPISIVLKVREIR